MATLNVALLQMVAHGNDQAANLAKGEAFCRQAAALGADIALFPEMWNIGYTPFCESATSSTDLWRHPRRWSITPEMVVDTSERMAWQAQAIGPDDAFLQRFRSLARELQMAIAITYLERWPGAPRNTVSLIDRSGRIVLTYAKVHTCDFDPLEDSTTPGDGFPVTRLTTALGDVHIGAMICFDREYPESARLLMLQGAEIILTPNACTLEANRIGQFRARAFENMVGVAMANYAAPQLNGHSVAFDAIAFDHNGQSRDTLIIQAGREEGVYLAPFDLEALRDYRQSEVWGNAFRRTHLYSGLVTPAVAGDFVRTDASGTAYDPVQRGARDRA